MQTKSELRIIAKNIRKKLDINTLSEKILKNFLASDYYKNSQNIALYYPLKYEINLLPILEDCSKNFYLPKIADTSNDMDFVLYKKNDILTKNRFDIPEPNGNIVLPQDIDIVILPALMADKKGFRLGYGKGYYDKFFNKNHISPIKIILIEEELLTECLPTEDFDVASDIIITQNSIIKTNKF